MSDLQDVIAEIKERLDLVEFLQGAGLTLQRAGHGYKTLCPFHSEKTPSLHIWPDIQRWWCFGSCNTGGDIFDFVQQREGLDFAAALDMLAQRAGVELRPLTPEQRATVQERREYEAALGSAAHHFAGRLPKSPQALGYAHARAWTNETIQAEGVGFADGAPLPDFGHSGAQVVAESLNSWAGAVGGALVYVHRDGGRVVYLVGRSIDGGKGGGGHHNPSESLAGPKRPYLNSRYSLCASRLIIVEGQSCAITLGGWGFPALAMAGAGPSNDLANRLRRHVEHGAMVYVIPDRDGKTDVGALAEIVGPLLHVVALPEELDDRGDVNAYAQAGATGEDLTELLNQAQTWLDQQIDAAAQVQGTSRDRAVEQIFGLLAQVPSAAQVRYKTTIGDRLGIRGRDFGRLLRAALQVHADHNNGFAILDNCLTHYGERLCNFSAVITHELTRYDGINPPDVVYTLRGILDNGETLGEIQVPASEFDSMRWVSGTWGARPIVYTSPGRVYLLRRAIQEVSCRNGLKRERVHTFTGWAEIDGRRLFLASTGGLGVDGLNAAIRVDLGPNNLSRYALPEPLADPRPAIKASLGFLSLAPYSVTLPLWIAMYAAPLCPIQSLNAVLWLYGSTQSGKSTLSHLALSHFGPSFIQGHEYKAPASWLSTKTDLEGAMFVAKDVPIVIDDYAPANASASEARALAKTAQDVIRSVGNRVARGRAAPDLSARQQRPPRGLVIATAENPIIGQSTVGRTIYVPVEPGQIIKDDGDGETELDVAQRQAQAGMYAQAMAGYIVWLAHRWDDLVRDLPKRIDNASKVGRGLFPYDQGRLADYYGFLSACMQLVFDYFVDAGELTRTDVDVKLGIYSHHLVDLLLEQGERVSMQSPVTRFWQAVDDLIAQGQAYLAPNGEQEGIAPDHAMLIGWYDEDTGHIWLLLKPALSLVKTYWANLDERFDTLADALRRALWQQGYLAGRDKVQLEMSKYIRALGRSTRVLVVDSRVVQEKEGITLLPT